MYTLTLTKSERDAITWIGHRYTHGDDLYLLLTDMRVEHSTQYDEDEEVDIEWSGPYNITFTIPEHIAWDIKECLECDKMACFSDELVKKMQEFIDKII